MFKSFYKVYYMCGGWATISKNDILGRLLIVAHPPPDCRKLHKGTN